MSFPPNGMMPQQQHQTIPSYGNTQPSISSMQFQPSAPPPPQQQQYHQPQQHQQQQQQQQQYQQQQQPQFHQPAENARFPPSTSHLPSNVSAPPPSSSSSSPSLASAAPMGSNAHQPSGGYASGHGTSNLLPASSFSGGSAPYALGSSTSAPPQQQQQYQQHQQHHSSPSLPPMHAASAAPPSMSGSFSTSASPQAPQLSSMGGPNTASTSPYQASNPTFSNTHNNNNNNNNNNTNRNPNMNMMGSNVLQGPPTTSPALSQPPNSATSGYGNVSMQQQPLQYNSMSNTATTTTSGGADQKQQQQQQQQYSQQQHQLSPPPAMSNHQPQQISAPPSSSSMTAFPPPSATNAVSKLSNEMNSMSMAPPLPSASGDVATSANPVSSNRRRYPNAPTQNPPLPSSPPTFQQQQQQQPQQPQVPPPPFNGAVASSAMNFQQPAQSVSSPPFSNGPPSFSGIPAQPIPNGFNQSNGNLYGNNAAPPTQAQRQQQQQQQQLPQQQQQQQPLQTFQPGQPGAAGQQQFYQPSQAASFQPQEPVKRKPTRIDPDAIPSPVLVMEEDSESFQRRQYITTPPVSGISPASAFGQQQAAGGTDASTRHIPPLASTEFFSVDDGNCTPRFVRTTLNSFPITEELLNKSKIPLAAIFQPLADVGPNENPIRVVDHGPDGPIRCRRCKAYINPHVTFVDGGRAYICNLCNNSNEVSQEYFCNLDHNNRRLDLMHRPELTFGTVEFVATKEYCNRPPQSPGYVFVIDVSYQAVQMGVLGAVVQSIKSLLDSLPGAVVIGEEQGAQGGQPPAENARSPTSAKTRSPVRVGFITYDRSVHFWNLHPSQSQPQMMIVGDVGDVFLPLSAESLLVDAADSRELILSFLNKLPQQFAATKQTDPSVGPAMQAAQFALKERGGKILFFQTVLPTANEIPGKLARRDDSKIFGTDKEHTLFSPSTSDTFYRNLAIECSASGISVDLFLTSTSYMDTATLGQVSALTGGTIYHYPMFNITVDGERLFREVRYTVTRTTGFDSIMRLRASTGLRPVEFYGNFYMRNTTDLETAGLDCDKAFAFQLRHDGTLDLRSNASLQLAVLYTNVYGQRRIRVHNFAVTTCNALVDLFKSSEMDTILNFMAKQGCREALKKPLKSVRETFTESCIAILLSYRKFCATNSSAGQLILPESLKLLPVYTNALLKSDAFRSSVNVDIRACTIYSIFSMTVASSIPFFYPRVICITDKNAEATLPGMLPKMTRTSRERLSETEIYLLDDGVYLFVWIGRGVSSETLNNLFGVPSFAAVNPMSTTLSSLDNPQSARVRAFVDKMRRQRLPNRFLRLAIAKQGDSSETPFLHHMVEDKGPDTVSYVEFLCHIHAQIQNGLD